jgi:hypothetical protein
MYFVASRSLFNICHHKINNPLSENERIPNTYPTNNGETIYCHTTALKNFILKYLPKLRKKFILVSGDSDLTVPTDVQEETLHILEHPLLLCWYAQNCVKPTEKLKQLPIGLDLHTYIIDTKYKFLKNSKITIESQEEEIKTNSLLLEKKNKCYGNFHFFMNSKYGFDRKQAYTQIPSSLIDYEFIRISRNECWKKMSQYKFIVSPHGNGLDCHRTWEALVLGCVPIVKTSPLDPLYENLPVLIVKEWSDITQELLDSFNKPRNLEKLTLSYWKDKFQEYK